MTEKKIIHVSQEKIVHDVLLILEYILHNYYK